MSDVSSAMWDELDGITLETVTPGLSGEAGVYHGEDQITSTSTLPGYEQPSSGTSETQQSGDQGGNGSRITKAETELGQQGTEPRSEGVDAYNYLMGIDASQSSSSGGSTGYGSGARYSYASSSNYNPRIYSNARSLNASRPSTMYSKQPRDASYSYLRPSFETRGSRSAYER